MKEKIINSENKVLNHTFSAKKILLHPLFSGSFFMIVGTNFANFIAYIYHLIFGRILGPSLYGELVATISLIGLIMSAFSFFGIVIVKFVSSAEPKDLSSVLGWFNSKVIKIAAIITVLIWIVSPFLGSFTHLSRSITILFAPLLFFSIISLVYRSFLQGIMKFKEVAILSNIELFGRLIFGLIFIYLNMKVFGAVLGMLLSGISVVLLTKYFLKRVGFAKNTVEGFNWKKIVTYALPVFVVSFSFTSLLTSDMIMVKHFFTSYDAGIYGAVSNLGKIIFYGTAPIGAVMFPLIAKKKSQKAKFTNIFLLSILLVTGLGFTVLLLYYLFPSAAINILYGEKYLVGSKYLLLMGLYYILYSIANLMSSFLLSIDLIKPLIIIPVFALIQIAVIYFFHNSIGWVIGASIISVSLLLAYLALYFAYAKAKISQ